MQKQGTMLLLALLLWSFGRTTAQVLTTTPNNSASQLASTIAGNGVIIMNPTLNCPNGSCGTFANGNSIGLNSGILLTSGDVTLAPGPNSSPTTTGWITGPGDPDLAAMVNPNGSFDACVLEFDIIPSCDSIQISYVFASEEYPEFVNSVFNDVFAFWISGPGYPNPTNIALIPGQVTPVSINTVNLGYYFCPGPPTGCANCAYYVENCTGSNVEYDGYTVPLQALAVVQPCATYHIKLAISDVGDVFLDSGVFLEASGIGCVSEAVSIEATNANGSNILVEGCNTATLDFIRSGNINLPYDIRYQVLGNATNGVDLTYVPDSLHFNAGQDSIGFVLSAPDDGINEGLEFLYIAFVDTFCNLVFGDTAVIIISDPPEADFTVASACAGTSISFTDNSTFAGGAVSGWEWDFGDGSTSNVQHPAHVYASGGTYTVTLIIDTDFGCKDTTSQQLTIYPSPLSQFSFVGGSCLGDVFQFTDQSTFSAGTIIGWEWNFGDGNSSTSQNPSHSYGAPGNYSVTLTVTGDNGCTHISVQPIAIGADPIASFNYVNTCDGETVQFNDASTVSPGSITGWNWDFGDGNTSTQQFPTHLYGAPGTYMVTLAVTTSDGCTDTSSQQLTIHHAPVASFLTANVCNGESVQFTDQSNISSGTVTGWNWDFGDGSSGTLQHPVHTYGGPGSYTVTLIVTSNNGCTDTLAQQVTVNPDPTSSFNFTNPCDGETVQFNDASTVNPGSISGWSWDFGDGNTSTQQFPAHLYGAPGTYTVTLAVVTADGCTDTTSQQLTVYPVPVADFSTTDVCDGETVQFTDQSTISSGNITNYVWNFGDGNSSTLQNPVHTYGGPGTYTVTLTITSDNGCTDDTTVNVTVFPEPTADFTVADHCEGTTAQFTDGSSVPGGAITGWTWDFGDGNSSTLQNPVHTYGGPGTYTVTLTITSDNGCTDDVHIDVDVWPGPVADFTSFKPCAYDTTYFTNLSTIPAGSIVSTTWDFGDGNSSTVSNPRHLYATNGMYIATLTVVSDKGCTDEVTYPAFMQEPEAPPIITHDTVCRGMSATVTAVAPLGYTVDWYFTSNGYNSFHSGHVFHTPPLGSHNTYWVQVTSPDGCKSLLHPVHANIYPYTAANIIVSDHTVEIPSAIIELGTNPTHGIISYFWGFGDGTTSTSPSPVHQYTAPGFYDISLHFIDEFGCEYDENHPNWIEVIQQINLFVPSAFSPNGDGLNDEFWVGTRLITDLEIQIFDRWGKLLFQSQDMNFRWNGQDAQGMDVPEGAYTYRIRATTYPGEIIDRAGTITVIR